LWIEREKSPHTEAALSFFLALMARSERVLSFKRKSFGSGISTGAGQFLNRSFQPPKNGNISDIFHHPLAQSFLSVAKLAEFWKNVYEHIDFS